MNKSSEDVFSKNIKIIKHCYPVIAEYISKEEKQTWIKELENNIILNETKNVYSIEDPRKEAKNFSKQIKNFYKQDMTVILGGGIGYSLEMVLKRKEEGHKVVVIETHPILLQILLSRKDYTKSIEKGELVFATNKEEISIFLSIFEEKFSIRQWYFIVEAEEICKSKEHLYTDLKLYTLKLINQMRCNTGTIISSGKEIAFNDIANLPYVIRHRGVNELKDFYKNKPVICVSTGPSLEKNIHLLKDIQDKVIIVAVAQALRPLLAYNVSPDFICTVDFGKVNATHFNGLMNQQVPLITLNRVHASLLKRYQGPKFITAPVQEASIETASQVLIEKGYVEQGGSVAHLCFNFAYQLGCNPIILIGQDLALSNRSHISQVDSGGTVHVNEKNMISWKVDDPGSNLHGGTYSMGELKHVPGYYGTLVPTNTGLYSFLTAFENLIEWYNKKKETERVFINSTEGGANINGCENIPLNKVFEKYCIEKIDKDKIKPLLSLVDNANELIKKVIPLLKSDIDKFNKIIEHSKKGLETQKIISKKIKRRKIKGLEKLLDINTKHTIQAHQISEKIPLIRLAIFDAIKKIKDRSVEQTRIKITLTNGNIIPVDLKRNKIILNAALKQSKILKEIHLKVLTTIEKYNDTKNEAVLISPPEQIKLEHKKITEYLKVGNFAWPLHNLTEYLEQEEIDIANEYIQELQNKIVTMKEKAIKNAKKFYNSSEKKEFDSLLQYISLVKKGKSEGKKENYSSAIKFLYQATKLFPDKEIALWGLASAYSTSGKLENGIDIYLKLIQINDNNLDYKMELGRTYIKLGIEKKDNKITEKGIDLIKKVLGGTKEYDRFFKYLGDLFLEQKKYNIAADHYREYLKTHSFDLSYWKKLRHCLEEYGKEEYKKEIEEITQTITNISK